MAEYDPSQTIVWDGENEQGYEEGDDIETSHIQHSSEEQENEPYVPDHSQHVLGDLPSRDGATDEVGAYDPESLSSSLPVTVPATTSVKPSPQPAVVKKPRTAGGFLVGDSDDEDEQDEAPQVGAPSEQSSGSILLKSAQIQDPAGVPSNPSPAPQVTQVVAAPSASLAAQRLVSQSPPPPVNRIADLEKRVLDDPRGALDAWQALIAEHKRNNDIVQTRQTFDRVLAIFPQAADIWVEYLEFELDMNNFSEAEIIFGRSIKNVPNVKLWTKYLDYIRRRNDVNDPSGEPRLVVASAYEFVIDNIGLDKDSGKIWAEYLQFLKSRPGNAGGSQWEDQQKMDQLRKAYQRAIVVPIANVNTLWREYNEWEMTLNKLTGRKYLTEKSPSYMSAKSANTALENITRNLKRNTLPRLPPAAGFDGYQEYMEQVEIWKKWIEWEKSDPLDIKDDTQPNGPYQKRVLYVYKQALMALWFWPEMWVDAAQWCLENNISTAEGQPQGLEFLTMSIQANPESVLLALRHADYIESTYPSDEKDEAKIARGKAVRAPYDRVLDALYEHVNRIKDREATAIRNIQESAPKPQIEDADDDESPAANDGTKEMIKRIQDGYAAQTNLLKNIISFVWIALIRAMRRIQGKGKPNTELGGMRQAFQEARQRGHITSAVYSAVALMEWVIYKEPAGGKIFDRGAKLFPQDETFALENIKYLHSRDDYNNARVLFETVVGRLTSKPETVHKAKALYAYMHKYESTYGELAQIAKLEKRMAELFPEDRYLTNFSARYSSDNFDPISAPIIVSPATQTRPPAFHPHMAMPSVEQQQHSPRPGQAQLAGGRTSPPPPTNQGSYMNSPKRALQIDDYEESNFQPRKMQRTEYNNPQGQQGSDYQFQRGASPLKGAAGRRLAQQRVPTAGASSSYHSAAPAPIARDITFLLSLIPRADLYDGHRLNPRATASMLQRIDVPDFTVWKQQKGQGQGHARKVSVGGEYGYRGGSPFVGGGRPVPYREGSVRPGSSGSYEPPPAFGPGGGQQHQAYETGQGAWGGGYSGFGGHAPPPSMYGQGGQGRYPPY
ncbi:hypothetical protein QBC38DRAFT_525881 [Podospora fimiseda]|uniref:mRNA 3'-end-processing protein RNA14 n=1 Tax=Podospora fimiseda TaxID=252190 RepID=A0AAN7H261_9PEZI|nr:hypothetical protein QBC38DRAFT_525881 [Podospora fimiseda]